LPARATSTLASFCWTSKPGNPALAIRSQVASSAVFAISALSNFVLKAGVSCAKSLCVFNAASVATALAIKVRLFIIVSRLLEN
jgi:hypothetical protein